MARRFAAAMSQAPGLSGIPASGQRSRAATSASWAKSSATPTSRTILVSPAISFADSIRHTASMVRWMLAAVAGSRSTVRRGESAFGVGGHPFPDAALLLAKLGGELGAEIFGLEYLS